MKKLLVFLISLILLLYGCSSKNQSDKKQLLPSELLTISDVSPYLDYEPVLTQETSRRVSTAIYQSEPKGKGYPVIVKIYQENGLVSKDKVKSYFDECKNMRSDSFDVSLDANAAFIAYPTLHYYVDGYHIEITAGSGNNDLQKVLLTNLAKKSIENFYEITGIKLDKQEEISE